MKRSPRNWLAAAEAAALLAAYRLMIVALPNERLLRRFGTPMVETAPDALGAEDSAIVDRVRWAVGGISARTPFTANCLPQALTARSMLARRGLASTLYLGAAFTADRSALRAHAWLRCGDRPVTGGRRNEEEFGAIVAYG